MTARRRQNPEWREFERLVARIEADAGPQGLVVKSPDRLICKLTGRKREVDASIRARVGSNEILITIECRRRQKIQDVTWIEQLSTNKSSIGADRTIAVSLSGFSAEAQTAAFHAGISLRKISEISTSEINALLQLDTVLFWHRAAALVQVGIREFRSLDWKIPRPNDINFKFSNDIDQLSSIFRNTDSDVTWSINDLLHQIQEIADPFDGIKKAEPPVFRTACFPYPGTVTVNVGDSIFFLGEVLLTIALWIEAEQVILDEAHKVEYTSDEKTSIQRVEFTSRWREANDWRISLQIPKDSNDIADLRTGGDWPMSRNSDTNF